MQLSIALQMNLIHKIVSLILNFLDFCNTVLFAASLLKKKIL